MLKSELRSILKATAAVAAVATASACEGLNPTPGPTVFAGVLAGATESGSLTFEGNVTLVAVLKVVAPSSSTHTLPATYDPASQELSARGDGYMLAGTVANGVALGSYTGPNGSGAFSVQAPAPNASVRSFCGTYTVPGASGILNLVVYLSGIAGVAVTGNGHVTFLTGTFSSSSATVDNPDNPSVPLATGSLSGTVLSGAYDDGKGNRGTWKGSLC